MENCALRVTHLLLQSKKLNEGLEPLFRWCFCELGNTVASPKYLELKERELQSVRTAVGVIFGIINPVLWALFFSCLCVIFFGTSSSGDQSVTLELR